MPRGAIDEIAEFVDEFDLKYRRVDGYSIKERLKEARQRAQAPEAATRSRDASSGEVLTSCRNVSVRSWNWPTTS